LPTLKKAESCYELGKSLFTHFDSIFLSDFGLYSALWRFNLLLTDRSFKS
jgi:hypothetical protein